MADPVSNHSTSTVPADDPTRTVGFATPDTDESLLHVCVAGDTYTMLLQRKDTGGKYYLIDMHVPPGGGPPLHRHDFEEMLRCSKARPSLRFAARKKSCAPVKP